MMKDQLSFPNKYHDFAKPKEVSASVSDDADRKPPLSSDQLEVQITNRASEISQQRNNHDGRSLASWLEAAKEILSKDANKAS